MPLAREVAYWEDVSKNCVDEHKMLKDNAWKRPEQLRRLMKYPWMNTRVLEIGTGNGLIAGVLQVITLGNWKYIGTELAPNFRKSARAMFQIETVEADVRELPEGPYDRIIAFDSLEHVRPEHRAEGYKRISAVAAEGALLFIHFSRSVSLHDKEFDHPFDLSDILCLQDEGFTLNLYERYACMAQTNSLDYVFVVMQK